MKLWLKQTLLEKWQQFFWLSVGASGSLFGLSYHTGQLINWLLLLVVGVFFGGCACIFVNLIDDAISLTNKLIAFAWSLPLWALGWWQQASVGVILPVKWLDWFALYRHVILGVGVLLWLLVGGIFVSRHKNLITFSKICGKLALLKLAWVFLVKPAWQWGLMFVATNAALSALVGMTAMILGSGQAFLVWLIIGGDCFGLNLPAKSRKEGAFAPKKLVLTWGMLVLIFGGLVSNAKPLTVKLPQFIAHRAMTSSIQRPNSLAALVQTSGDSSVTRSEFDVQLTRDNYFVVSHDDRIVNARRRYRLAALSQHFIARKLLLPQLSTWLATAKKTNAPLLLEIKVQPTTPQNVAARLWRRYHHNLGGTFVWVHSFSLAALQDLQTIAKQHHQVILVGGIFANTWLGAGAFKGDFYSLNYLTLNAVWLNYLNATHRFVLVWTVNSPLEAWRQMSLNATGIISDDSPKLKGFLNKHRRQTTIVKLMLVPFDCFM